MEIPLALYWLTPIHTINIVPSIRRNPVRPLHAVLLLACLAMACVALLLLPASTGAWDKSVEPEALLARLAESMEKQLPRESTAAADALHGLGKDWGYRADFLAARYLIEQSRDMGLAETLLVGLLDRYTVIHDQVLFHLARALAMNGRTSEARAVLARLYADHPRSSLLHEATLFKADLDLLERRPDQALLALLPLLSDRYRLEDNEIRFLLVKAFISLDRIDESRDVLKGIIIHAPGTVEAVRASRILEALGPVELEFEDRLQRAHGLARFRRYEEAAAEYEMLLAESPGNTEITDALGRVLFSGRRYDKVGAVLGRNESADNAYIEVRSLYRSGDQEGFLRRLEEVRTRYPELHGRLYALRLARAQDLRRAKDFAKAEELFLELLPEYPEQRVSTLWELGWSQYLRGDFTSAADTFLRLSLEDDPSGLDRTLYWLARTYEHMGESDEARELLRRLEEVFSNSYYGTLARGGVRVQPVSSPVHTETPELPRTAPFMRANELRLVGLLKAATRELDGIADQIESVQEVQAFAWLAAGVNDFSRAVRMAEPLSRFNPAFEYIAYPRGFWTEIEQAAGLENIDPYLVASIIRQESRFNPLAYSSAGAMGLMQLMPATARRASVSAGVAMQGQSVLFDPDTNIRIGTHHLAGLVREYGQNIILAVAAYNAGRSAVAQWTERKHPIPADEFVEEISYSETRDYVKHVIKNYIHYRELWGLTPPTLSAMVGASEPGKL